MYGGGVIGGEVTMFVPTRELIPVVPESEHAPCVPALERERDVSLEMRR